jgi:serine/threonine protein kinase
MEAKIAMKLDHPNIAKVYETWQSPEHFFLVMELCQGGELLHYIADQDCLTEK